MRDCDGDGGGDSGACNRDLGRSDMRHRGETRRMSSDSEEGDAIVCSDLPRRSAKRNEAMQCNNEGVEDPANEQLLEIRILLTLSPAHSMHSNEEKDIELRLKSSSSKLVGCWLEQMEIYLKFGRGNDCR